jgi:photosystem II stability/assembly factor-like uncharacterized protein
MRFALALALAGVLASATAASARNTAIGVPGRFHPEAAAAVGTRDLWVLGDGVLLRSTDGGKHFVRVVRPPIHSRFTPTLTFANARDGYAYVGAGTPLYATRDGGASWQRSGPAPEGAAFATAGGYAYMVVGRHTLERSPVGRNAWQKLSLPFSTSGGSIGLAAYGSHVWVVGTTPSRKPQFYSRLGRSSNRGSTFVVHSGPCEAGLPGGVTPFDARTLWAVCSSGMMASLALSTNGGRTFAIRSFHDPGGLGLPSMTNAASIAPASARVAVLTRGAGGAFLRTIDGGLHWSVVPHTGRIQGVIWLVFTTSRVGAALVQIRSGTDLWRTMDAGASWHSLPIR